MRNNLKILRTMSNMSQAKMSKFLNVSQGTLSNWERGEHDIDLESLARIAAHFNVSTDYILGISEPTPTINITPNNQQKKPPAEAEGKKEKILAILDNLTDEGVEKVLGMTLLMFPEDTEDVSK